MRGRCALIAQASRVGVHHGSVDKIVCRGGLDAPLLEQIGTPNLALPDLDGTQNNRAAQAGCGIVRGIRFVVGPRGERHLDKLKHISILTVRRIENLVKAKVDIFDDTTSRLASSAAARIITPTLVLVRATEAHVPRVTRVFIGILENREHQQTAPSNSDDAGRLTVFVSKLEKSMLSSPRALLYSAQFEGNNERSKPSQGVPVGAICAAVKPPRGI
eukprot:3385929-Rhodomonas_salina.3